MPTTAENNFFRKKHTTSVTYLVALLLFFLPFVQIKCNDLPFAENTGMGLAFGKDYKVSGGWENRFGRDFKTETKVSKESGKMYVLALVALIAGVAGLFIALSLGPRGAIANMVLGSLAALSLIIVMIQITADVKQHVNDSERSDSFEAVKVTADFTLWYYLSVCSFLAAVFFSYKHRQLSRIEQPSSIQPAATAEEL